MNNISKLHTLGLKPLDSRFRPLEDDELNAVECAIGHALPSDYRLFLARFGASRFYGEIHVYEPAWDNVENDMLFFGAGRTDAYALLWNIEVYRHRMLRTIIPIGDSGDSLICIGVAGDDRGSVFHWDREFEAGVEAEDEEKYENLTQLAASFDEFITLLTSESPECEAMPTDDSVLTSEYQAIQRYRELGAKMRVDDAGHVTHLYCSGRRRVSKGDLQYLRLLPRLMVLHLDDTSVGDEELQYVATASQLEELVLRDCKEISDEGVEFLRGCHDLRVLDLTGTQISSRCLQVIGDLRNLKRLALSSTNVNDDGSELLVNCRRLEDLDLNITSITDASIEHICKLRGLITLSVGGTGVSDESVDKLQVLPKLETVNLNATKVTEEGVARLRQALPEAKIVYGW